VRQKEVKREHTYAMNKLWDHEIETSSGPRHFHQVGEVKEIGTIFNEVK
jgi:hypothetical protein